MLTKNTNKIHFINSNQLKLLVKVLRKFEKRCKTALREFRGRRRRLWKKWSKQKRTKTRKVSAVRAFREQFA